MRHVAHRVRILQMDADGPDVPRFERRLLAQQLPLVPGFPMRMFSGFHDRPLAVDRSLILVPVPRGRYRGRWSLRTSGQLQTVAHQPEQPPERPFGSVNSRSKTVGR